MKEIGMEKLIELLNEYDGKNHWWDYDEEYLTSEEFYGENGDLEIISKKFGFIKWLVENDKIDKSKVFSFIDTADKPYEDILCLLALSDEPISDLISFLK